MWRRLFYVIILIVLTCALSWFVIQPSHDREWRADHSRLPAITETDGIYTINHLRNWTYGTGDFATSTEWLNVTLDPAELERVWLIMEPFGNNPAIAHTMLSFEFTDGNGYVVSVEARREVGEGYRALLAALVPTYEYLYVWSTERDMFGKSQYFTGDQLYMYPLDLTPRQAAALLTAFATDTMALEAHPRWYHTLLANCTNVLVRVINGLQPGILPWDIAWLLPGYADTYLYEEGWLAVNQPFAEAEDAAHLSPHIDELYRYTDPATFSKQLRQRLSY